MKDLRINTLHRYVGIVIAPFLVIQALSGLLLDFGLFRGGGAGPGGEKAPAARSAWDLFLMKIHFGPGLISSSYHLLLGAGIIWMAVSGWVLYLRLRRARRKAENNAGAGQASGATRP